ncbi:alkyl sulfatase C-terminal domain-containing protein [Streptomyces albidoflavus]
MIGNPDPFTSPRLARKQWKSGYSPKVSQRVSRSGLPPRVETAGRRAITPSARRSAPVTVRDVQARRARRPCGSSGTAGPAVLRRGGLPVGGPGRPPCAFRRAGPCRGPRPAGRRPEATRRHPRGSGRAGRRAEDTELAVWFRLTDGEPFVLRSRNGVLTHHRGTLRAMLVGEIPAGGLGREDDVGVTGEPGTLAELFAHLGEPGPDFAIDTP